MIPARSGVSRFAILGNHLPRHCGIATFTTHLADALTGELPGADGFVLAMNDAGHRHDYPARVRFEIDERELAAYRRAADFLNVSQVDVLSVQHEYGIFGGRAGAHVLELLRELRMPIVTTLHTVLSEPNPSQRSVLDELAQLSARLVVMSRAGAELLQRVHGVAEEKIDLIPHGIPTVPATGNSKDRLGVEGKSVILTFGLLSSDKGIEYVIDAMPAILAVNPETVYIVLGATHPHVIERDGESYRLMLEARAQQLGVDGSLIFHNRFVSQEELTEFLSAADIYITPYLNPEQITSGTLAYAVGAGKAVISTPYIYARELLAEGRGVLVPWRDCAAIAKEVITVLGDAGAAAMRGRAAALGVTMTWPAVARQYLESFARARTEAARQHPRSFKALTLANRPAGLPELDLRHVRAMTDDTGMLQHAVFNIPRYEDGYCLDDNARALLLVTLLADAGSADPAALRPLASRYLAFVSHAFDRTSGRFRNFLSYARHWLDEPFGSEDSHGRALWALGAVVGHAEDPGQSSLAGDLFHAATPAVRSFSSPRAWAYALLGIDEYLRAFSGDSSVESLRAHLAEKLLGLFERTRRADWPWFEDSLTYCNGRLPQALLLSGSRMHRPDMVAAGLASLEWLVRIQTSPEGLFAPVGSNGFYSRGHLAAVFDQQPVEACATTSACLEAHRASDDARWVEEAQRAFNWLLGHNHLREWLYDAATGGCRDGLHVDRVNRNEGAEATLSFQLALVEIRSLARADVRAPVAPGARVAS